ncbi:hypothetical protein JCM10207_009302 [Rhodosporidiobolus poonsookiae]
MSPIETHRCCVCAVETANRCAACAAVGTDLFFCSKEHQKLVWNVHKRFCGKAGFEHPLLQPEEAERAKEIGFTLSFENGLTLASMLLGNRPSSSATKALFKRRIDSLTVNSGSTSRGAHASTQDRSLARDVRCLLQADPSPPARFRSLHPPLAYLQAVENHLVSALQGDSPASRPWYLPLMHQFAIVLAVASAPGGMLSSLPPQATVDVKYYAASEADVRSYLMVLKVLKHRVEPIEGEVVTAAIRAELDETYTVWGDGDRMERRAESLGMLDCV